MKPLVSILSSHINDFIEFKRLSGYKYEKAVYVLSAFDSYYNELKLDHIKLSRDVIEPFIELKPNERITNQVNKATVLRQFGKYLFLRDIIDSFYLIPPISAKGESEYIPYIFNSVEYSGIIKFLDEYTYAKNQVHHSNMLNCVKCAIKTLMSTGMRLGEVLNLKLEDVDFEHELFYLKEAKNNNQRLIPFSQKLKNVILQYIKDTPFLIKSADYLFQTEENSKLNKANMHLYFYKAIKAIGIEHKKGIGPRIHDMRHTFAVMSLTQLQECEKNVNLSLSYLSTYLGHKSLKETQKYIWLTPSLFKDVKDKMSQYSKFIFDRFEEEKFDEED